jgi:dimethylhistidine N-methyltransferase
MYSENYSDRIDRASLSSLARSPIALEALEGLSQPRKTLPPKLFYDAEGCRLFQQITELPEYYLTRTERGLLQTVAPAVAALTEPGTALVEYGASDESKALTLLSQEHNQAPVFTVYLPIDIAADGLAEIYVRLRQSNPELEVCPVTADFTAPVALPSEAKRRLGFFPGSTIGNFEPTAAIMLLRRMRMTLGAGARLLIGVDLRKDPSVLLPAYNDAAGVTAAFNRNILVRLNREAEADFDPGAFAHRAVWNDAESRIEMHLVSLGSQVVHLAGRHIRFATGETIHTENSYKYTLEGFAALARVAGWHSRARWSDSDARFSLHLLEPESRAL